MKVMPFLGRKAASAAFTMPPPLQDKGLPGSLNPIQGIMGTGASGMVLPGGAVAGSCRPVPSDR